MMLPFVSLCIFKYLWLLYNVFYLLICYYYYYYYYDYYFAFLCFSCLLSCHYELISFLLCHLMDNEFSLSSDLIFDLNFVLEKTQNRIVLKKKKSLVLVEGQSANVIIWQAKEDNVFSGESTAGKPGCYSWNHTCLYHFQKLFKVVVITCFTVT